MKDINERWKIKDWRWKMNDEIRKMKDINERLKIKDYRWKIKHEKWMMK